MTFSLEISSEKLDKLNRRARQAGLSSKEFGRQIVELIVDASDEDFESWLETLDILSDAKFAHKLAQSIEQAGTGQVVEWEEVKRDLKLA